MALDLDLATITAIKGGIMEIGVFTYGPTAYFDPAVLAQKAEELGYHSYWVPEHPILPVTYAARLEFYPEGVPTFYAELADPFVALARASAVTKTIKLGTGICLVPERNPLLLAKEVATLDRFSGGRFLFGIGAGWLREEMEILGGNFEHRWGQTREAVLAMKELWTTDEAQFHGQYYDFPLVRSFPKPVQKPHPPILIGEWTMRNAFNRIVAWGDGWMPVFLKPEQIKYGRETLNQLAVQAGREPSSIQVVAFGAPADTAALNAFEEAGADQAVILLEIASEKEAWAKLEEAAQRVLG
jgi:probable F420-dependent oxidoreductase